MPKKTAQNPADYIVPLNMNGLQGRMLYLPAPPGKKREILLLYGHHSSLERWWGIAQVLNKFGAVCMPDIPGFGGMDSMYKIGKKPTVDNLADYLASFVRMRYSKKRVTIIGMSFGFVIATRMLQRFPNLTKKVDLFVSLVGFAHKDDFTFTPLRYWFYRSFTKLFSLPMMSKVFSLLFLQSWILSVVYKYTQHPKFVDLSNEDKDKMVAVEIWLWHNNDVRTWMYTTTQMLTLDNCTVKVDIPVWHAGMKVDHFFDNTVIEQHLRIIFSEYNGMILDLPQHAHAPTVIADAKDAAPFIPPKLRRRLAKREA
jgi:pimeloyl-ACP methyl ester carboxylesterase